MDLLNFLGSWSFENEDDQSVSSKGKSVRKRDPRQVRRKSRRREGKLTQESSSVLRCLDNVSAGIVTAACSDMKAISDAPRQIWKMLSFEELDEEELEEHQAIVAVAATAITDNDIKLKKAGATRDKNSVFSNNFVGVVHRVPDGDDSGLHGMRVAGFTTENLDNRFVKASRRFLIPISLNLDAPEVAVVLATYLPAFQALLHGVAAPARYSREYMENRRVLIRGGNLAEAQASAHLARILGARDVYLTAPDNAFRSLKRAPAIILSQRADRWPRNLKNSFHIIVDYEFPVEFNDVQALLKKKGRLVCIKNFEDKGWFPELGTFIDYYQLVSVKGAALYNFSQEVNGNFERLKEDFYFLLKLLDTRQLRPAIDSFVHLEDAEEVRCELAGGKSIQGTIVCEPWKKQKQSEAI